MLSTVTQSNYSAFTDAAWVEPLLAPGRRPPTTMDLLGAALERDNLHSWARRLGLSEQALRTARSRGRLSPSIAGALAQAIQQDPVQWIVIAALETERESACKRRMLEQFGLVSD